MSSGNVIPLSPYFGQGYCQDLDDVFNDVAQAGSEIVHAAIDVQTDYIFSQRDEGIARHIGKRIAPQFAKHGIQNCWFYYRIPRPRGLTALQRFSFSDGNNYRSIFNRHVIPHLKKGDKVIAKNQCSAVAGSEAHTLFQSEGRKVVMVSGFSMGACIPDSALDFREKGYKVVVLADGTDMEPAFEGIANSMKRKGIVIADSNDVFARLSCL